jgi:hypothetical protein
MTVPKVSFVEVQAVLESAIAGWRQKNGNRVPNLTGRHNDPNFGWATKQQLLTAKAKGFQLIDHDKIGKQPGQGKDTNLVKALRDTDGVDENGQMPDQGPFLKPVPDIQKIIDWIDGGCLD